MATHNKVFLFITLILSQSAIILLLTTPIFSHCGEVSGVGQALVDRGHNVHILIGSTFDHKECFNKGYNGTRRTQPIITGDSPDVRPVKGIMGQREVKAPGRQGNMMAKTQNFTMLQDITKSICTNLFYDKVAFQKLKNEKFDLVITYTVFFAYCYFVLPYKLGVPYVGVSSHFQDFISGRPLFPTIVPLPITKFSDSMTFWERLGNAVGAFSFKPLALHNQATDVLKDVAPELSRQDLLNLASKCELYLYNYDVTLAYPVPVMPNHVLIGGIAAGPAKTLPDGLNQFYKKSTRGVVLVTFGSYISNLEKQIEDSLKAAFRRLDISVLWKHDSDAEYDNIKQVKWLPQNDLLGNSNTKVFVSHCGNIGVFEALYHGVPLVCTPVFADQYYNGIRVQQWKAGKTLPLATSSEDDFYDAINTVLTDPTYRRNMKRASKMYHSQPMTARERVAFWVEYILKFGGDHLRSRASEMSWFTYMGYDLVCFIFGGLVIVFLMFSKCFVSLLRCCRRTTKKLKTN